jgi:hypothetical protein
MMYVCIQKACAYLYVCVYVYVCMQKAMQDKARQVQFVAFNKDQSC